MLRKLLVTATVFSLIAAPISAQASERQSSTVAAKDKVAGISTMGLVIALAIAAAALVVITHDNNTKDRPASP